jgi:hypothetical protein
MPDLFAERKVRAATLGALCALFFVWTFPGVRVTYSRWQNGDSIDHPFGEWSPLKVIHKHASVLTELGYSSVFPETASDLQGMPRYVWRAKIQRAVQIDWIAQTIRTVFVIGAAFGLLWVLSPQTFKRQPKAVGAPQG